ncbi:phospholipase [Parasulfuritortus cantonensis]|uniref:Phospholipase n=1 Tax=Parasulfuritortus cantonensis TaxID=2528202 RepID=A0A4R1BD08_9PROT|nr:AAA domain-containing protein [Parasulfuritortus cantonensis]TCJ14923.1 phospholipase [Parasulfuritortus cantonensis]
MNNTNKYAAYWRHSLADAELGKGAWKRAELDKEFTARPSDSLTNGVLDEDTLAALFKGEPDHIEAVDLIIKPWAFVQQFAHGKRPGGGLPEIVTPLSCTVRANRSGEMLPSGKTVIARDILDPVDRGAFAIGQVSAMDEYLTRHGHSINPEDDRPHAVIWKEYLNYCTQFMNAVIGDWPQDTDKHVKAGTWYLKKVDNTGSPSKHIIAVYDDICQTTPDAPLFATYALDRTTPDEPCRASEATFGKRLGHSGDEHPLADAQRDALTHLVVSVPGEIVAVNGPPGTGKTTMLLSAVASLWAQAALEQGDPPVIVAASTNNQAVTNILDAFGKDFKAGNGPFAGRWLPDIKSFGAYFPSSSKLGEAAAKYQTPGFFDTVEAPDYFASASKAFITAGKQAFPSLAKTDVSSIVEALHAELRAEAAKLSRMASTWTRFQAEKRSARNTLGTDPYTTLGHLKNEAARDEALLNDVRKTLKHWNDHLASESFWLTFFSWIPAVEKKRVAMARRELGTMGIAIDDDIRSVDSISHQLKGHAAELATAASNSAACAMSAQRVIDAFEAAYRHWKGSVREIDSEEHPIRTLADADRKADTTIRFRMFLLATHYWEGRWLLEIEKLGAQLEELKGKRGRQVIMDRWRRRMMLTPCVVSTFFMLPTHLKCRRREGEGFTDEYLYDFADLLIVDEAGQVLPEVAGASFALAKRALVIGDTLQIEPIWAMPGPVDVGNLISAEIMSPASPRTEFERLRELGITASSGSVMKIAQNASRYHYDRDLARGLFLYEHRRCLSEIIDYCNQLCYHGKLIPSRDENKYPSKVDLPAMGYLHIDGMCTQGKSGSRQNKVEAETIAAWISEHREMLEQAYGEPLHKVIGVVTPFAGQAGLISAECKKRGIAVGPGESSMTIGTVHALQGAERWVIVFSPTYSKHADGRFIDRNTSMLNVAVSRAKDSFLVFGDMDMFNPRLKQQPRGLLASHLFRSMGNELSYPAIQRADMADLGATIQVLHDAEEHDAFLLEAIESAKREVLIVTPWFKQEKLSASGVLDPMLAAISRGVKIAIYTDLEFNRGNKSAQDQEANERTLMEAREALESSGIQLVIVNKVHSKIVACDDDLLCMGSFNWFGAAREGDYKRHETSLVYKGSAVSNEIVINRNSLQARQDKFTDKRT